MVEAMNIQSGSEELLATNILVIAGIEPKQPIASVVINIMVFFLPSFSDKAPQNTLPITEPIESKDMKVEANWASTMFGSLALNISFIRGLQVENSAIAVVPYITKVANINKN